MSFARVAGLSEALVFSLLPVAASHHRTMRLATSAGFLETAVVRCADVPRVGGGKLVRAGSFVQTYHTDLMSPVFEIVPGQRVSTIPCLLKKVSRCCRGQQAGGQKQTNLVIIFIRFLLSTVKHLRSWAFCREIGPQAQLNRQRDSRGRESPVILFSQPKLGTYPWLVL